MRDKPIVYLAGCLDAQADQALIFLAAMTLQNLGYETIDEYDLPHDKGLLLGELRCFANAALGCCDIACFLEGWRKNPSAVRELALCKKWRKPAVDYADFVRKNRQMQDLTDTAGGKGPAEKGE
jgi:hypothetical protein